MRAFRSALKAAALLLLAVAAVPGRAQGIVCTPAHSGSQDELILFSINTSTPCIVERWNPLARRRIAAVSVAEHLRLLQSIGNRLVCASLHEILVGPSNLSTPPKRIWRTRREILRITPFRRGWLTLVVDRADSVHPIAGQVYWFPGVGSTKPRLLSLRRIYNFWDIQSGDMDGDGREVIALCTWSRTSRIRRYARRYFIYGVTNHYAYPRWRGSRLSKPYVQARLVKAGTGPDWKLLSVEQTARGTECLMLYQWDDFGFFGLGRSTPIANAEIVANTYGAPVVKVARGTSDDLVQPELDHETLALRRICALKKGDSVSIGKYRFGEVCALVIPTGGINASHIERLPVSVP